MQTGKGGKSDIYKIQREKFDECYVGQTKRNVDIVRLE